MERGGEKGRGRKGRNGRGKIGMVDEMENGKGGERERARKEKGKQEE